MEKQDFIDQQSRENQLEAYREMRRKKFEQQAKDRKVQPSPKSNLTNLSAPLLNHEQQDTSLT